MLQKIKIFVHQVHFNYVGTYDITGQPTCVYVYVLVSELSKDDYGIACGTTNEQTRNIEIR